jgi:hypothetical protein
MKGFWLPPSGAQKSKYALLKLKMILALGFESAWQQKPGYL